MMSFGGASNWVQSHSKQALLGAGGVAAVVVLALRQRNKTAATAAAATGQTGTGAAIAGLSGQPNTYGTDQGNYFQDQINALQTAQQSSTPAAPSDSPRYARFVNSASPTAIYQIENGKAVWLNPAAWAALVAGGAQLENLTTLDSLWAIVSPNQYKPPTPAPKPPTPAPKPAPKPPAKPPLPHPVPGRPFKPQPDKGNVVLPKTGTYSVPAGGSLYGAAQHIYGTSSPTAAQIQHLAGTNGIRLYQRNGTTMADVHPGQQIRY